MLQVTPPVKRLPSLVDTRRLFTMLFDPETVCSPRKAALQPDECAIIAVYRDNEGAIRRLLVCDLGFSNSAGAALSAIPAAAANKATLAGRLADNVLDNLSEVMNVAVNLFIESFGARLELGLVARLTDHTPETLAALKSDQRVKIDVAIPRYERGRVDLIAV